MIGLRQYAGWGTILSMDSWIVFAVLSALSAGAVAIFGKIGLRGIDATLGVTIQAFVAAGFLGLASLVLSKFKSVSSVTPHTWFFIVLSGVAGALSWLLYFMALKRGPVSPVVALGWLSVIFVFIFAVLFLHESFTWRSVVGALCIVVGAVLMTFK